jgi:PAS domain S-box-containing protein
MKERSTLDSEFVGLIDQSADAFCITGPDGRLVHVNPAFARGLGHAHEQMLRQPFLTYVFSDDRASVELALSELVAEQDLVAFECRQVHADGSVRWFEWKARVRGHDGHTIAIGRDTTALRSDDGTLRALHRIATLVAEGSPPLALFKLVAEEVTRVVNVPIAAVARYELDGTATECATILAGTLRSTVGTRWSLEGRSVLRAVQETVKPARIDDYSQLDGEIATFLKGEGIRSSVGTPIVVAGRLWGALVVSTEDGRLPDGMEARLADFTELMATAIANVESRETLERLADEQATLRRVATLVARAAPPEEVFTAVATETARLRDADLATLTRFEADGTAVVVGAWPTEPASHPFPVGSQVRTRVQNAHTVVLQTGRSARIDDFGPKAEVAPVWGIRSTVVVPIHIGGRLWGALGLASTRAMLAADSEVWLTRFTELVAMAVANAESRSELVATSKANAEARETSARLADQQAALRRISVSIARGDPPRDVFEAVCEEAKRLFGYDLVSIGKFDPDGPAIVAAGASKGFEELVPVGTRWLLEEHLATTEVYRTGRAARADAQDWTSLSGSIAASLRQMAVVTAVAVPIFVEDRLWGAMTVSSNDAPLPPDTEQRLESFTELAATAIANAESRVQLAESRRRIVTASDEARRRIERNLHDGAQQRLVSLGLAVRTAEALTSSDDSDLRRQLSKIATGLTEAVTDLQEISRGIHPAVLSRGGLGPALRTLARRSTIPVALDVSVDARLAEPIEVAAYFVTSEALANATKHAQASEIEVALRMRDDRLVVSVRDDGVGGAEVERGSGLMGLVDRVEALGGVLGIESQPGEGTMITAELPLQLPIPDL